MLIVSIQWLLLYFTPAMVAFLAKRKEPSIIKRASYIHIFVALSVGMLTALGVQIEWGISQVVVLAVIGSAMFSIFLLRGLGAAYVMSVVVQETCLLLAAVLLSQAYPLWVASLATAATFAVVHRIDGKEVFWKPLLLISWSVASIYLYSWLHQPLINMTLHIFIGAILIRANLLLTHRADVTLK